MKPQPGDRIRITGVLPFDPDPLETGATGTVTAVRNGQVHADWDNGRRFLLLETDPFEIVSGPSVQDDRHRDDDPDRP